LCRVFPGDFVAEEADRLVEKLEAIVSRWTRLEEHHARALADLQHSAGRIQQFERRLHQQGDRAPQDEFIQQSADDATPSVLPQALLSAFERIETRLADIHVATVALTRAAVPAVEGPAARIDQEPDAAVVAEAESPPSPGPMFRPDPFAIPPRARESSEPPDTGSSSATNRETRLLSPSIATLALIAAAVAVGYALQLRARTLGAEAQARSAEQQLRAANEETQRQLAAVRDTYERELTSARQSAARASAIADVLAAPDLIRFDLEGTSKAPRACTSSG
jgi:hypothetical protein